MINGAGRGEGGAAGASPLVSALGACALVIRSPIGAGAGGAEAGPAETIRTAAGGMGSGAATGCGMRCAICALAMSVQFALHFGHRNSHGTRPFTGSTSNAYFDPQAHKIFTSITPRSECPILPKSPPQTSHKRPSTGLDDHSQIRQKRKVQSSEQPTPRGTHAVFAPTHAVGHAESANSNVEKRPISKQTAECFV